jgi:hypothetical protein
MNYIYLGLGDLYLPAVAAALHLNRLEKDSIPSDKRISDLPHFRSNNGDEEGKLFHIGTDSDNNNVYVMAVNAQPELIQRAVTSLIGIYEMDINTIQVRPCLPENPQVGNLFNILNSLGIKILEQRLACRMIKNRFDDLVTLSTGNLH